MKKIIFIITLILLAHLSLLYHDSQRHKSALYTVERHEALQQVVNIIRLAEATPINNLAKAINTAHFPNASIHIEHKARWATIINTPNYDQLHQQTPANVDVVQVSHPLRNGEWLNIQVRITVGVLWSQLILFLIEIIAVIIIIFYLFSINRFARPLKNFQKAAESLGVDLKRQTLMEFKGPKVVQQTAQAMNRMQQRIIDLIENRSLMFAALSHDLRTPMTRLKLRADFIDDQDLREKTIHDIDEMEAMLNEIISFARNDMSKEALHLIDLVSFVKTLCDQYIDLNKDIEFHCQEKTIPFDAKPLTLKRALSNILENAFKYGESAKIYLQKSANKILITIEDQGPGIAESDLEKVLEPFYRCDQARSQKTPGMGLGLAIAKSAVLAHGGQIHLQNIIENNQHGLRVTLQFEG
jgi:signal transduction histidine kinase